MEFDLPSKCAALFSKAILSLYKVGPDLTFLVNRRNGSLTIYACTAHLSSAVLKFFFAPDFFSDFREDLLAPPMLGAGGANANGEDAAAPANGINGAVGGVDDNSPSLRKFTVQGKELVKALIQRRPIRKIAETMTVKFESTVIGFKFVLDPGAEEWEQAVFMNEFVTVESGAGEVDFDAVAEADQQGVANGGAVADARHCLKIAPTTLWMLVQTVGRGEEFKLQPVVEEIGDAEGENDVGGAAAAVPAVCDSQT